jgi:hypothetical protein
VLYRSADPLDALEIAIFGDGDELGWHFDNSEFSVTVMYQQAEAGGHFDYRGDDPGIPLAAGRPWRGGSGDYSVAVDNDRFLLAET